MGESPEVLSDREIRDRIVDGVHAFAALHDRFRRKIELHLLGRCQGSDGRSREKAVEIASQVLADCFARSPSLLEKWKGDDNLEAFLRTVAANRLKSWWDSRDSETEVDSDSRSILEATSAGGHHPVEQEELMVAAQALAAGVEAAVAQCPEGLVFLRLKGLHGVDQRALADVWNHHEAQTSRRIREAMMLIRASALAEADRSGIEIDSDMLQQALQTDPTILLGRADGQFDSSAAELLRRLASGDADRVERDAAVALMSRNAGALEFFAQLLNRSDGSVAVFVRDPALQGMHARLSAGILRASECLPPAEVRHLVSPLMSDLFRDALGAMGADGGTLWWLSPKDAMLEAVFNPLEPEIAGKRQPLVAGIISLVIATSEPICVESAADHQKHSAGIDAAMGKKTGSMIAVPFRIRGAVRGVLTAVRFGGRGSFGPAETAAMERVSQALESLMDAVLVARLTEVDS